MIVTIASSRLITHRVSIIKLGERAQADGRAFGSRIDHGQIDTQELFDEHASFRRQWSPTGEQKFQLLAELRSNRPEENGIGQTTMEASAAPALLVLVRKVVNLGNQ